MLDPETGEHSAGAILPATRRWLQATHWADLAATVVLASVLVLVLLTFADYGVTFDEGGQDTYGQAILSWYASFGADRQAVEYRDLYFYGGLFDTIAALVNLVSPFGHFETRHLANGLVGVLGLAGCWRLGRHLGGPLAGLVGLCLLAMMPSWYGMMFVNPKDIPFATGMVWGVLLLTRLAEVLPVPPRKLLIALGLVFGLTLATRIGGVLLFLYLGLVIALHVIAAKGADRSLRVRTLPRTVLRVVAPVVAIAWVVMLVFWPYAQINPILNPLRAYWHFSTYTPGIETLFFGNFADDTYRPIFYLPVYLILKLPDIAVVLLLAATAAALGAFLRGRRPAVPRRLAPVALSLIVPLAYVLLFRPELYDAERHFLFLLPALAVMLALVTIEIGRRAPRPARAWATGIAAFALVVHVSELRRLHPYEYVFYNNLIGGVAGAKGLFETEYWGAAVTEAADRLTEALQPFSPLVNVVVDVCGDDAGLGEHLPPSATLTEDVAKAHYYISTTRFDCDQVVPGREFIRIERDGVAFAIVKELPSALALRRAEPQQALPGRQG